MLSDQIRAHFLDFFQQQGHLLVPSAPLVPRDDPSLLLVSAGMVPFKPFFLGLREPPQNRLTSCQKAFRTVDIEEVGNSPHHDTFFEMLGNFSFGSYFKEEAIQFAFTLLTGGFGLDPTRLHPSVHPSDEASIAIWQKIAGIPASGVVRMEDNFWQAGPVGPCGVDSEIYYDLGPEFGAGAQERPGNGRRFLEIWNLVFMDGEQLEDGTVRPLTRVGVDTGMGLERIAMVLQGKRTIFDTDLFHPILADFDARAQPPAELSGDQRLRHLRILADHTRGACCLIADGVIPSNEGRGYILRRILRRAMVSAQSLEVAGGLMPAVAVVGQVLGRQYPNLLEQSGVIADIFGQEEDRFGEAVARGLGRFQEIAKGATSGISGDDAFLLHDTFGFPLELTLDLAGALGLKVDRKRFEELLSAQRDRARSSRSRGQQESVQMGVPRNSFCGYDRLEVETEVLALLREGVQVASCAAGSEVQVVLAQNPFYSEGGGQVGDRGELLWEGGRALVLDSQSSAGGSGVQICRVDTGTLAVGATVTARVDPERRGGCASHHSATHLLNQALRVVLGPGVVQRGSLVAPDHATFDFSWPSAISNSALTEVEAVVNLQLRRDLVRSVELMSVEDARGSGALALPEETYGLQVRVVSFGDFSRELCGGTHLERTGQIGAVVLTGSRSIGQGLRRIELLAGLAAERHWQHQRTVLGEVSSLLKSNPSEVPERVVALQDRARQLDRELRRIRHAGEGGTADSVRKEQVGSIVLMVEDLPHEMERAERRRHADRLLETSANGVGLLLAGAGMVITISEALVGRGLNAGTMAQAVCRGLGGQGGGNQQLGQGGIPEDGHHAALTAVRTILESALEEA